MRKSALHPSKMARVKFPVLDVRNKRRRGCRQRASSERQNKNLAEHTQGSTNRGLTKGGFSGHVKARVMTESGAVAEWRLAASAVATGNGTNWVGTGLSILS